MQGHGRLDPTRSPGPRTDSGWGDAPGEHRWVTRCLSAGDRVKNSAVAPLDVSDCEEEHEGVDVTLEGGSQCKPNYESTACKSSEPVRSLATAISVLREG